MELQKKIYNFILEYWKMVKKYTPPPKQADTKAWDAIVDEADALAKKYDDGTRESKFFRTLIVEWLAYIGKVEE